MPISQEMPQKDCGEAPTSFRDFAARFSKSEWKLLHEWQMELYELVMKEIQQTVTSLGPLIATSVFSLQPVEKDDLLTVNVQDSIRKDDDAVITSIVPVKIKEEDAMFMDHPQSEKRGTISKPTEPAITTSIMSVKIKEEEDVLFVDCQNSEKSGTNSYHTEQSDVTQIVSFIINEDVVTNAVDQKESETRHSIHSPVGHRAVKRKMNYVESLDCSRKIPLLKKGKEKLFQIPENQPDPRTQWLYRSNHEQGQEITTLHGSGYMTDAHFNSHSESAKEFIAERHNELESNRWSTTHAIYPENRGKVTGANCENTLSHSSCLIQNLDTHSEPANVQPNFKMQSHNTEYEKTSGEILVSGVSSLTVDRPYACNICDKHFTSMSKCVRHQVTHSQEKPFQCTECEKRFNRSDSLVRHQRSHTKEFQAHLEMWSANLPQ